MMKCQISHTANLCCHSPQRFAVWEREILNNADRCHNNQNLNT